MLDATPVLVLKSPGGREGGRDVKFTEIRLAQCAKLAGKISLPNKNITYYNGREQELSFAFFGQIGKVCNLSCPTV